MDESVTISERSDATNALHSGSLTNQTTSTGAETSFANKFDATAGIADNSGIYAYES